MSANGRIDLRRDIVAARIDGMICRAEKAGKELGIEAGKLEVAGNMLEDGVPVEKIVKFTGLAERDILNVK